MLTIIALAAAALIVGLLAYAVGKPDKFSVVRETSVKASPEKIFALINDFHNWTSWSPYEKRDLEMKRNYSGSESGKGAIYEWDGNDNVGQGRMEILETTTASKIVIKLDFFRPFEGHNTAEFSLMPNGDSTKLSWTMFGPCNFFAKVMHCFIDMDKMIGKDFEDGLANIKSLTEK